MAASVTPIISWFFQNAYLFLIMIWKVKSLHLPNAVHPRLWDYTSRLFAEVVDDSLCILKRSFWVDQYSFFIWTFCENTHLMSTIKGNFNLWIMPSLSMALQMTVRSETATMQNNTSIALPQNCNLRTKKGWSGKCTKGNWSDQKKKKPILQMSNWSHSLHFNRQ